MSHANELAAALENLLIAAGSNWDELQVWDEARKALARYRAAVAADAALVSAVGLTKIGFRWGRGSHLGGLYLGVLTAEIQVLNPFTETMVETALEWHYDYYRIIKPLWPKTMGDVRHLCNTLGITLNEPAGGGDT